MTPVRMKGKVKAIIRDRGFFFVYDPEGMSRFIHASSMNRAEFDRLRMGDEVEFTPIETSPDRLRGIEAILLKTEHPARDERSLTNGDTDAEFNR